MLNEKNIWEEKIFHNLTGRMPKTVKHVKMQDKIVIQCGT